MPSKKSKITIDKIPEETIKLIRNSFSYKGLLKALNSKIISKADIKAEAINEQKNKDLLMDQRAHTVLTWDLENNKGLVGLNQVKKPSVNQSRKETPRPGLRLARNKKQEIKDDGVPSDQLPVTSDQVNKIVNKSDSDKVLEKLKQKLSPEFGIGWKGIDPDGDLLEVIEISDQGWIKFKIDKISGQADIASFPIGKFLKEIEANPIYSLDQEDAHDLASSNLKKLNNNKRLSLMSKIHSKTMAKLRRIKSKQRDILEQVLRKNEDKKIKELLASINSG